MITLIWKELRENFKWAVLAMLALGGAELYALFQTRGGQPEYAGYNFGEITLCKTGFLLVTTYGTAGVGFLLGLLQLLPELKRDRWATLLHRPVSRDVIYLGKIAAGVLLYILATVPPFLCCVWLAVTPGHFPAPFVPELALPGVTDTCTGLLYYFAALGLALQRGGRPFLRALPLLAAIHVSFFVTGTQSFSDAVWAAALMLLPLALAGWGAMRHQWSWSARPWLGRVALFAVAFYGLCGVGDFAGFVFSGNHFFTTRYEISDKGVPLKIHYANNVITSVTDVEGHPPQDPDNKPERIRNHVLYLNTCSSYIGDSHGWKASPFHTRYRQASYAIFATFPFQYPRMEQWFYLERQRTAIGMLPETKAAVATLGADGFHDFPAKAVPFAPGTELNSMGQDSYLVSDAKGVKFINLAARKTIDAALPSPGPIFGATGAWARKGNSVTEITAVALGAGVAIYDEKGGDLIATLPYHRDVDRWGELRVGVNAARDHFYLWYLPSVWIPRKVEEQMPSYFEEVDRTGTALHSYTLPHLPGYYRPESWPDYLTRRIKSPAFFFGTMAYQKIGAACGSTRLRDTLAWRLGEDWPRTKEIAIAISILSLLLAVLALWWARRAHFPWKQAWSWAGATLVFNIAGLIIFRLAADWPRLVPCSNCQHARPVDKESCPHCREGWAELPRNGTEIFDQAGESAAPAAAIS